MVARADGGSGSSWIVTDYSCYSLDDIWASVNQSDARTWPQIDAWNTMASVCAEQAGQLKLALAQLMQRWVPTSGSAAEAFAATVNTLIAAMQRDATAAGSMQPVLVQITAGLADTKDKVQALVDQRDHYVAVERAHLANPLAMRLAPASSTLPELMKETVPANWRQDLRAQAVAVMHAGDATIGLASTHMPDLTEANVGELEQLTIEPPPHTSQTDENVRVAPGPTGVTRLGALTAPAGGAVGTVPKLPIDAEGEPAAVLAGMSSPASGSGSAVLADPGRPVGPPTSAPPVQPAPTPFGPVGRVVEAAPGTSTASPSDPTIETRTTAAGSSPSMMAPPLSNRMSSGSQQRGVRRAGRPALWASQRKRASADSDDPWAVPIGVPAVIEPDEPQEHDPGPGVIGLDR